MPVLSPHGEAIDFELKQFENMLASECFAINDGTVFASLGQALHNPNADLFPLRMQEPYPAHGIDDPSSRQNVGLTTIVRKASMLRVEANASWLCFISRQDTLSEI